MTTTKTLPETLTVPADLDYYDRAQVIAFIRTALRARSGKAWSVTGGTGTAYGWIHISAPPARREHGRITEADQQELEALLGIRSRGEVTIADSKDYRREYVARAAGHSPEVIGTPYWD